MGDFGGGVSVLLDTYTRCLELLKTPVSKRHRDPDAASRSEARSRLRASMRSDRAQIRQAYVFKLSASGSCLDKGDGRSRSAMRRILDRIRKTMRPLLAKARPAASDYDSVVSLSSTWRSDALRTMDQLSHRLSRASSPRGRRASNPVSTEGEASRSAPTQHKTPKRSSFATTSSDSTQLGEIPPRTARRHRHSEASSGGSYGMPTIYPLYAYGPAPQKRSLWQRLFSNGK